MVLFTAVVAICGSQRCPQQNLRTCECVTFHGKRGFAALIQGGKLGMGKLSWVVRVSPGLITGVLRSRDPCLADEQDEVEGGEIQNSRKTRPPLLLSKKCQDPLGLLSQGGS